MSVEDENTVRKKEQDNGKKRVFTQESGVYIYG